MARRAVVGLATFLAWIPLNEQYRGAQMIRVIYRWEVEPADFEDFKTAWAVTTNRIHESVAGALGSFMLRPISGESQVLTVATWESETCWRSFWGNQDPREMRDMRRLGKRLSVDVYEEIADYTR